MPEPSIADLRDEFNRTSLISTGTAKKIMGDKPDYLDAVVDFIALLQTAQNGDG